MASRRNRWLRPGVIFLILAAAVALIALSWRPGSDRPVRPIRTTSTAKANSVRSIDRKGPSPSTLKGKVGPTSGLVTAESKETLPDSLVRGAPHRQLRIHLLDLVTILPVAGVMVTVEQRHPPEESRWSTSMQTSDEGIADFTGLLIAGPCTMRIQAHDYREVERAIEEGETDVQQWIEPQSFPSRPRLVGWAVGGEDLVVWEEGERDFTTSTGRVLRRGEDGAYSIEFHQAGRYRIAFVSHDGDLASAMEKVSLMDGQILRRDFHLTDAGILAIRNSEGLKEVHLDLAGDRLRLPFVPGMELENGDPIVRGETSPDASSPGSQWVLRPGSYRVELEQADGVRKMGTVVIEAGEVTVLEP